MIDNRTSFENKQKLYSLLKQQHEAEKEEILHYSTLLKDIDNRLIRNYFTTLLNDGIKHIQYITSAMAKLEGASGSSYLSKKGIEESIGEEEQSRDLLKECLVLTSDSDIKELITSIIVDEEHHIQILKHVRQIVESYSDKQDK